MGLDRDILPRDSEKMNTSPAHKIAEGQKKRKRSALRFLRGRAPSNSNWRKLTAQTIIEFGDAADGS